MAVQRTVSILLLAAGVFLLLLADMFSALSALSSSFASQRGTMLALGVAAVALGLLLTASTLRRRRHAGRSGEAGTALTLAAGAVLGWLAFGLLIYNVQDALVFSPRPLSPSRLERIATLYPQAEDIEIAASDGTVLRGWLLPPAETPAPLVIVFSGNAGEASSYFELSQWLPDMAWAFVNYRGYGASGGTPSDAALFSDATAIFDYLASRPDIDGDNVFALGGSLGTGVATYLAAHRPLAGVVLFSPYDSIGAGVAQDLVPWLPTGLFFRHRFDAAAHAPNATAPVLAVVGEDDQVIRPARSLELLRHWGGPYELITVPGGDHYSIYEDDEIWLAVQRFVRNIAAERSGPAAEEPGPAAD